MGKKPTDTADCHAALKSWCDHTQKHRGQRFRYIWQGQSVDSGEVNQTYLTVSISLHFMICNFSSRNWEGAKNTCFFSDGSDANKLYVLVLKYMYIYIYISADPSKGEGAREAGILRIWG